MAETDKRLAADLADLTLTERVLRESVSQQPHLRGVCWCGATHIQVGDTVRYQ